MAPSSCDSECCCHAILGQEAVGVPRCQTMPALGYELRTSQPSRLRQPRQVHAASAVPDHGIEIHCAVVAVGEGERERTPRVEYDLGWIEVGNPAATGGHLDRSDGRGITAVDA